MLRIRPVLSATKYKPIVSVFEGNILVNKETAHNNTKDVGKEPAHENLKNALKNKEDVLENNEPAEENPRDALEKKEEHSGKSVTMERETVDEEFGGSMD